jgi:CRP-like cAMP-binding protein
MNPEELKSIAVLQAMDTGALTRLAAALEEKIYGAGETVFDEGDAGDSMYFILKGNICIEKHATAAGAARKTLTVLEDGDYFGEMALMDQKPRSAAAVAAGNARVLRLSKEAFDQIQQSGSVAGMGMLFAMIRTSSERIRRLSAQLVVYDEVGKAIGEAQSLQELLDVILRQLATATGADWGMVLLRGQFSEELMLGGQLNLALTPAQLAAVRKCEGFLGPTLQNAQDLLVADFDEHPPFQTCERLGFETASLLISPISLENQSLGLILLGDREHNHFNLDGLTLARGIARQAAQAILNARHREEEQARSRHSRQFVRF